MKQLLNTFGGVAGLVVAGLAGLALFTLVGGLIVIAGIVITALVLGGGVYALVTGRAPGMRRGAGIFGTVRIIDLRTGRPYERPSDGEMIDVTPKTTPRAPRRDGA